MPPPPPPPLPPPDFSTSSISGGELTPLCQSAQRGSLAQSQSSQKRSALATPERTAQSPIEPMVLGTVFNAANVMSTVVKPVAKLALQTLEKVLV